VAQDRAALLGVDLDGLDAGAVGDDSGQVAQDAVDAGDRHHAADLEPLGAQGVEGLADRRRRALRGGEGGAHPLG
jgi:hypothetical protein